jgi:hypothetical protein
MTSKYLKQYFIPSFNKLYTSLNEDQKANIEKTFIKNMTTLSKNKFKLQMISLCSTLITGATLLIILGTPYLLLLLGFITSNDIETISKYIQTGIGIIWTIFKFIYNLFGVSNRILIHDQTIIRLKQEGTKFINKDYDERYGVKRKDDSDKYRKFINKVNSKITSAVVKYDNGISMKSVDIEAHRDTIVMDEKNILTHGRSFSMCGDQYLRIKVPEDIKIRDVNYIIV